MGKPSTYFVFDVESVGLHGEGFAVGVAIMDAATGEIEQTAIWCCSPLTAKGYADDYEWVNKNVDLSDVMLSRVLPSPKEVRKAFWDYWLYWKVNGAVMAADVAWPVEARFLAACVDDNPVHEKWQGPYPLIDIASVRHAAGFDPLALEERREDELPAHNPLADARQSARLLHEALTAR